MTSHAHTDRRRSVRLRLRKHGLPVVVAGYLRGMRLTEDFLAFLLTASLAAFAILGVVLYAVTTLR